MGLDNGFIVKDTDLTEIVPEFVHLPWDFAKNEIAYFRKYWGMRTEIILDVLHVRDDEASGYPVELDDMPAIFRIMQKYMNPTYWEENADSVWEWEDAFPHLVEQYINLKWLYDYWRQHPELEVSFYDSY